MAPLFAASRSAVGRGRLPVWVVRMRCSLRRIAPPGGSRKPRATCELSPQNSLLSMARGESRPDVDGGRGDEAHPVIEGVGDVDLDIAHGGMRVAVVLGQPARLGELTSGRGATVTAETAAAVAGKRVDDA